MNRIGHAFDGIPYQKPDAASCGHKDHADETTQGLEQLRTRQHLPLQVRNKAVVEKI